MKHLILVVLMMSTGIAIAKNEQNEYVGSLVTDYEIINAELLIKPTKLEKALLRFRERMIAAEQKKLNKQI